MITPLQLKSVCPSLDINAASVLAPLLVETCTRYGISKQSLPYFLANLIHESGGFTIKVENLNYTTPERLVKIWPSRFSLNGGDGKYKAGLYVRNPEALAILTYNGRMGNRTGTKDGFTFRGGGYAQLTGRDAYEQYFKHVKSKADLQILTVEEMAHFVMINDKWAMDSAGWFFSVFKKLNGTFDFMTVVKKWNGGTIGYTERVALFNRCKVL